ncbi:MAG: sigma-54-dependent Fis family transcriptional regulator, partial [Planctomycetes bacterium]|nr:sigma-54-dependent Fis family transcriptional regulator [Planctomycetota bacterium]
ERRVKPVGGSTYVEFDARIIAATRRDLEGAVNAGTFRSDLYFRLAQVRAHVAPLRQRLEDIPGLIRHILEQAGAKTAYRRVTRANLERLLRYDWPGNVRELQNVVEYATVMGEGPVLTEADLPPEVRGYEASEVRVTTPDPELSARRAELPPEARRLLNALERAGGHMSRAAASLGMSRTTLWRKLKKHGLDRETVDG